MISTATHTKHAALARQALGRYGRHEWAILGTPCGRIQQLAATVTRALSDHWRCAYLDADHTSADAEVVLPGLLAAGTTLEYTDRISHHQWRLNGPLSGQQMRQQFQNADLILVNGNHHEAAAQIVVIDPAKEASLRKRLHQLTDVRLILLVNADTQVFDFVENALPDSTAVPHLHLDDTVGIVRFFEREMAARTPLLNGLVLAGGRSQRMGRDKSQLNWHGKPQREYVADLLRPFCEEVLVSCRPEQAADLPAAYPALPDTFVDLGPYGAILSAFRAQPDRAWLVVACDLPLLDAATLDFLVDQRQPKHVATAFVSPRDQMPEPLIAIWEPKSYPELLAFLGQGYSCPRKVLLNTDSHCVAAPNPAALSNANTPEDLQQLGFA